jgi:hypothetical protein
VLSNRRHDEWGEDVTPKSTSHVRESIITSMSMISYKKQPKKRQSVNGCKRYTLIRAESKFRTRWDIVVILMAMWVCIFLPV